MENNQSEYLFPGCEPIDPPKVVPPEQSPETTEAEEPTKAAASEFPSQ